MEEFPMFETLDGRRIRLNPVELGQDGPGKTISGYLTPEIAKFCLSRMVANRRPKPGHLRGMILKMTSKQFLHSPDPIAWDNRGHTLNGMHRAYACIEADARIEIQMSFGWPVRTQDVIDVGANRSAHDQGVISGTTYMTQRCAAIRAVVAYVTRDLIPVKHKEVMDFQRYCKHFEEVAMLCVEGLGKSRGRTNVAPFVAAMVIAYPHYPDEVQLFIEAVKTQANLSTDSPAYKCAGFLHNSSPNAADMAKMTGRVLAALDAFRTGKKKVKYQPVGEERRKQYLEGLKIGYFAERVKDLSPDLLSLIGSRR